MKPITISSRLALPNRALLFDLDTLYAHLQRVKDQRKRRGVRYPLAEMLMIGILAKLAGQTSSRAIAEWAQLRKRELAQLFALRCQHMPHFSTWSRILSKGCDPDEVEEVLGQFFAEPDAKRNRPGERQLCIDGKTLRGTIPLGQGHGVHLLAAYLPREGVVLGQVQASHWGSEPSSAPKLLRTIDLRGTVVTADAIFASRGLSVKILQAKGDYLWIIKENQKQMYQEIQTLFEPQPSRPGWSAPPMDFRVATTFD